MTNTGQKKDPTTKDSSDHHAFLVYCKDIRQLSDHTCNAYRRDILKSRELLDNRPWNTLKQNDFRSLAAQLFRRGQSPRSIQRILSAMRSFYRYLQQHKICDSNPVDGVKSPKPDKKLPQTLSVDDMDRLLNFEATSPQEIRDKAILELFYSSGLRLSELHDCTINNLNLDEGLVRVTGKGNKTRIVPVGMKAREALTQWLNERQTWNGAHLPFVFLSNRGQALSRRSIQTRIKLLAQKQGIWQNIYPHLMRHSFASHVLESSNNLRGVQELLGHADISTTQIYTHLNFQHLAQVYDKAHPRAKRKK